MGNPGNLKKSTVSKKSEKSEHMQVLCHLATETSEISEHMQVLCHLATETSEISEPVLVSPSHASVASVCVCVVHFQIAI